MLERIRTRIQFGAGAPASNDTSDAPDDAWVRWAWVWSAIFYGLLLVCTSIAFLIQPADRVALVILFIAGTLWHYGWAQLLPRRRPDWREYPALNSIYLIVLAALWYIQVSISGVFYLMLFGIYSQIFYFLPTLWAIAGSVLFTAGLAYAQAVASGEPLTLRDPGLWMYAAGTAIAILFSLWIDAIIRQSAQRKELIRELQQAQDDLAMAERRAGMLAERERLARDIHDTLAQGFTSIVMHLEAAEQALPAGSGTATAQRHLDRARRTARDSLGEARRVMRDLRPAPLEDATLPEAIRRVATNWSDESGIPAEVQTTGDATPLAPAVEVTLLRAAQEALANVRKHASASTVTITLSYLSDIIILDVQDNGVGMDTNALAGDQGGFGLNGMRERVERLDGSLFIESDAGEGTTLVVEIPIT